MTTSDSFWEKIHGQWALLASPMRPAVEDIALYQQALTAWRILHPGEQDRVLLLGVTPELRAMAWPPDADLLSCDRSGLMIKALWPSAAFSGNRSAAICADWSVLPLRTASRNIIIGDGWATIPPPEILRRITAELARVLSPGGLLAIRLYLRPRQAESIDALVREAMAGRIRSFHVFKWRLVMAVQGDAGSDGALLGDVWKTFSAFIPDRQTLALQTGWSLETIGTIDAYRDVPACNHYYSLEENLAFLLPAFDILSVEYPGYELGERSPVVAARRR